jgi:uncharacterized protein YhaN
VRIRRLDLIRYGHFTDRSVDFPESDRDIHLVFGPNEAGKSTLLAAISELLFGIDERSRFGFLHGYGDMRIGALLAGEDGTLEIRRRKGRKDTLLGHDDLPLPGGEARVNELLGGAGKGLCELLFSLDHERLRRGGAELLDAREEVGQALFSAGSGIFGLRERLDALEQEADSLWGPRRSERRAYSQASDELEAARHELREATLATATWRNLQRERDESETAFSALEEDIAALSGERRRLARIRRVLPIARRLRALEEEARSLGEVPLLEPEASERLAEADQKLSTVDARLATLEAERAAAEQERDQQVPDLALLQREQDVVVLVEERARVQSGLADLPRRRADLEAVELELRRLAAELGWPVADGSEAVDALAERLPPRAEVARVRGLLGRQGALVEAERGARKALADLEESRAEIEREGASLGASVDVGRLTAEVRAQRQRGDPGSAVPDAVRRRDQAAAEVAERLVRLRPPVSEEWLLSTSLPSQEAVQEMRDLLRDLDRREEDCSTRTSQLRRTIERLIAQRTAIVDAESVPSPDAVLVARGHRDLGWSLLRRRFVERAVIEPDEVAQFTGAEGDLADAYEESVRAADGLADRRSDQAQVLERIALLDEQIEEKGPELGELEAEARDLAEQRTRLEAAWLKLWEAAGLAPEPPGAMLTWIGLGGEILERIEARRAASKDADALREEERLATGRLAAEMAALGEPVSRTAGLHLAALLEMADALLANQERLQVERERHGRELARIKVRSRAAAEALEQAVEQQQQWQDNWVVAVEALGLQADAAPATVGAQLDLFEELNAKVARRRELLIERIGKIERDARVFASAVEELATAVAPDLAATPAQPERAAETALRLRGRLDEALRARDARVQAEQRRQRLAEQLAALRGGRDEAEAMVRRLAREAHLEGEAGRVEPAMIEQLREAVTRSDSRRRLERELAAAKGELVAAGDAKDQDDLEAEAEGADPDLAAAREEAIEREDRDLRGRLGEATDRRTAARHAFESAGGDDRAGRAEARRQEALADLRDVVERYLRLRSAARLLRWSIERYRRENQGPMLARAGAVFKTLTGGSFERLAVDYDAQDRAVLLGERPDGGTTPVAGMSDGTTDQLYLALRLAAIEDYLERAPALPFVADDLFVNWDDERARAGLSALATLAGRTQVLVFTHHRHLVELARKVLDGQLNLVEL